MNDSDEHLMTVFTAALDCKTAEARAAYLDHACADAPEFRARVEALLRAHQRGGNFLGANPPDRTATLASAPGPGVQSFSRAYGEELRRLLRSRLILVHLLALTYVVLLVMMTAAIPRGEETSAGPGGVPWWLYGPPLAESLVGAVVLWRRPGVSLRGLRTWELACFATHAAFNGCERFASLTNPGPAAATAPLTAVGYAGLTSLQGFVTLVLAYGLLVPNTRRRSLAVVGALSAVPLGVIFIAAVFNPLLRHGHVFPLTLQWALILLFPAAIAVFTAARATALQRRAFEAERRAERLGQYALKRKLGEGGMGEVWLAEHGLLKRPCAVKFIRAELAASPAAAARFAREVQAVTGLSHFNTVRVYDYGRADDGSFYLVMEYLDGPTLQQLVDEAGPLPPGRVVALLRQVCGALAEAHAAGLVHRDIKPGNIIVSALGGQKDVAKLLDFGLVSDLSSDSDQRLTRTGMVLGTPAYMSPEQAAGESAADVRGDVYSLGAVAFFALTGRPPFQEASLGRVLAAHRTEMPPSVFELRPDVPSQLAEVVARCLEKAPSKRYSSAVELERALEGC